APARAAAPLPVPTLRLRRGRCLSARRAGRAVLPPAGARGGRPGPCLDGRRRVAGDVAPARGFASPRFGGTTQRSRRSGTTAAHRALLRPGGLHPALGPAWPGGFG